MKLILHLLIIIILASVKIGKAQSTSRSGKSVVITTRYTIDDGSEQELLPPDSIFYFNDYALEKTMKYEDVQILDSPKKRSTLPDSIYLIDIKAFKYKTIFDNLNSTFNLLYLKKNGYDFARRDSVYNGEQYKEVTIGTRKEISYRCESGPLKGNMVILNFKKANFGDDYLMIPKVEKKFNGHLYKAEYIYGKNQKYIIRYKQTPTIPVKYFNLIKKLTKNLNTQTR